MNKVLRPTTIIPADLYVERVADRQLRAIVDEMGRPGYVLVARQMGKTNLLLNMKRERANDIVFYFDLSTRFDSARAWFRYVVDSLIEANPTTFSVSAVGISELRKKSPIEPSAEFDRSLRALLRDTDKRVIIILDEIDSLVNASYSDSILAQIRSMYFSRINYPEYHRLTYVLSGVAEPTDLIKDRNISPFNIGEKIYLEDFTEEEFARFVVRAKLTLSPLVSSRIFYWAHGNPRMTWDICSEIEDSQIKGVPLDEPLVDAVVDKLYLRGFDRAPVDHIRTLVESDSQIRDAIVAIRYGKADTIDDKTRSRLYLSGITRNTTDGSIRIKNTIIDEALSDRWVSQLASTRRSLVTSAMESFENGHFEEAVRIFESAAESAIQTDELNLTQQMGLGLSYFWTARYARAAQVLSSMLEKTSDPPLVQQLHYYAGASYVSSGAYEQGIPFLRRAMEGPDRLLAHQARVPTASALLKTGIKTQASEAIALCDDILSDLKSPSEALEVELVVSAYYTRAQILAGTNRIDLAKMDVESAQTIATPELLTALLLLRYELEANRELKAEIALKASRNIVESKLKLPNKNTGSLKLTRERIAIVLANLVAAGHETPAFELLDYVATVIQDPGHTKVETLLDLYDSLSASEHRRVLSSLIPLMTQQTPAYLQNKRIRLRVVRSLATQERIPQSFSWRKQYLEELQNEVAPEVFSADDAQALMQIAVGYMSTKVDPGVSAQLKAIHELYADVMLEKYPSEDIVLTFLAMRAAGQRGETSSAQIAAAQLIERVSKASERGTSEEWQGIYSHMSSQASTLLSSAKVIQPMQDAYRKIGRNQKLLVQYDDKPPIERKFKFVESDLRRGVCRIVVTKDTRSN